MLLALAPRMGHAAGAFQVAVWDTALAALQPVIAAVPVHIDMVYAEAFVADPESYQVLAYLADRVYPDTGCCDEPAVLGHHRYSYLASQILLYYCAFFIDIYNNLFYTC